MATDAMEDQFFTYEGRLASFQKSKNRRSTATGRNAKTLNWPHKKISPESLARAGFFFHPTPENPDNVECFLCRKNMDGWEDGDDPLTEHAKHSPSCGWAIVASIEAEVETFRQEDPSHPNMIEARKATFAGRWPHDSKRGWKCKTKQLIDAGWKYTPTAESDDMATCTYCQLALDGWEPNDKPLDEHYKRSPDCLFFTHPNKGTSKKAGRGKAARGSKASRLSTQSVATAMSEAPSVADITATVDDTVLTTASTMTQPAKKGRARKGTVTKGKKGKAKKEETPEPEESKPAEIQEPESPVAPPPAKAKRGKKRASDAMEDSELTATEAPAPKKRATKAKETIVIESSVVEPQDDEEMQDSPPKKKPAAKKPARASNTRKASTRKPSTRKASARVPSKSKAAARQTLPGEFPDDDEIERQLQADLERPLTDDEEITVDSDSERSKAKKKAAKASKSPQENVPVVRRSSTFAMFNPVAAQPGDAELEDELNAMQAEMEVEQLNPQSESEPLQVSKKGRKPGPRKASKQTKAAKKQPSPSPPQVVEPPAPEPVEEDANDDQDLSLVSTDTVITKEVPPQPAETRGSGRQSGVSQASAPSTDDIEIIEPPPAPEPPMKRGRGRPSKASLDSQKSVEVAEEPREEPKKRGRGRPKNAARESNAGDAAPPKAEEPVAKGGRGRTPKRSSAEIAAQLFEEAQAAESRMGDIHADPSEVSIMEDVQPTSPIKVAEEPEQGSNLESESHSHPDRLAPSTPGAGVSPSASARQAVLSPSQSPQSSDAENQPPSSKPNASAKRVALAPVAATPMRGSPSKRNVLAGLQSSTAWNAVDLDAVFGTPRSGIDKENGVDRLLRKGQELTSPEKRMTVEEWVYFNANEAENMLKHECEAMVSRFESEGTRAMNVLEGLMIE